MSTAPPQKRQSLAAAALLIVVLAGLTAFLLVAVIKGFNGSLTGQHGIGRFIDMVLGSEFDPRILTGIAGILGVGSAYVAGGGLSDRLYYVIVASAASSILLCLLMIVLLADNDVASALYNWAPQPIADAEAFRKAANFVFGGTCFWLVGVLSLQVGLHSSSKNQAKCENAEMAAPAPPPASPPPPARAPQGGDSNPDE
jgi:hypothetical protein